MEPSMAGERRSAIMPHLRFLGFIWFVAVLVAAAIAAADDECPESIVSITGDGASGPFEVTETSAAPAAGVSFGDSRASYDLTTGVLHVTSWVGTGTYRHVSRATVTDRFDLQGATAVTVTVRLHLNSTGNTDPSQRMAWIIGDARLTVAGQTVGAQTFHGTWSFLEPYVEVTALVSSGQPLEITCEATAEGWGYYPILNIDCQLEFLGLPSGARITSCNGFNSTPVPASTATWGAVKALYR
jgi:hypothetical protein